MADANFKTLLLLVLDAYERVYLDAMVMWAMLKNREVPYLKEKIDLFRNDPSIAQEVRSRFSQLRAAIEQARDDKEIREAFSKFRKKEWLM
jgi:predicted RNA methylase